MEATGMMLSVIIIISFVLILMLAVLEPLNDYLKMKEYAQYISDETEFYFKTNPSITAKILAVTKQGYVTPNVTLLVTYPDRTTGELITTLAEFNNLWIVL